MPAHEYVSDIQGIFFQAIYISSRSTYDVYKYEQIIAMIRLSTYYKIIYMKISINTSDIRSK